MTLLPTPPTLLDLERNAWCELARGGDPRAVAAIGLTATRLGPATAVRCRAGGPLLNRTYDAPARTGELLAVRDHYEAAGVPLYFICVPQAERGADAIERAGLQRYRRGMIHLARDLATAAAPVATSISIGAPEHDELVRAAEIFCVAFDADRGLAPVLASMRGAPGWHFLVARVDGEPAGLGILYVAGTAALLFGGATAPRFRRRGAQAALVAARVALARELGCTWIGGHTGEPVPDDPQHSFHNMTRAGLAVIGRVDSFAPPGVVWTHGRRAASAR